MRRVFLEALDRASARAPFAGEIVAIGAPCRVVDPSLLLASCKSLAPISFWHAPALALVGFGETVRIEGRGPERLVEVAARARALFEKIHVERPEAAPRDLGSRLVGGLSFRIEGSREAPWSAFADASFSLPRWQHVSKGDAAWLWLHVRSEELLAGGAARAAIESELHVFADALEAEKPSPFDVVFTPNAPIDGTSREAYQKLVEQALVDIRQGALEKVVAVAASRFACQTRVDARAVLTRLSQAYADTTRFAVERGGRVFLGASPERLVSRRGSLVETDALAGTAKRGADDTSIERRLLESVKDRHEHALVVRAITEVLEPWSSSLDVPNAPRIRSLRNVCHLWTPIRAVLREDKHVLALVDALHPTPAVAGTPRDRATSWIATHEPSGRGWYTGAVGWIDAAGDGDFAVAIRAGVVGPEDVWLYAGAGLVEGSDPLAEYAETRAKQAPMLAALGISA